MIGSVNSKIIPAAESMAAGTGRSAPGTAALRHLSPDDWKVISAAVGKAVGPEPDGSFPEPFYPILAFAVAFDRQSGALPTGSIAPSYFKSALGPGQDPDLQKQLNRAIDYLTPRESATGITNPRTGLDTTA